MGGKKFVLWPVSHRENIAWGADTHEINRLLTNERLTFFYEYEGSDAFNRVLSKIHGSDSEYLREIESFFAGTGNTDPFYEHNKTQLMLIKNLAKTRSDMRVVCMDYHLNPDGGHLTALEQERFYTNLLLEQLILYQYSCIHRPESILSGMDMDILRQILVDKSFLIRLTRGKSAIRESEMTRNMGASLEEGNSDFLCVVGASHAEGIIGYLRKRGDVEPMLFKETDAIKTAMHNDKAEIKASINLVGDDVLEALLHDATEIQKAFKNEAGILPHLAVLYDNARNRVLRSLPDDQSLRVPVPLAARMFGDFAFGHSTVKKIRRGGDEQIAKVFSNAVERCPELCGKGCGIEDSIRMQTLDRIFRRYSQGNVRDVWKDDEVTMAVQIFKTEIEKDARKLARREAKSRSISLS
ncbi:MAG: hypothetical protein KGH60_03945 [Candidatus Micrarchaeota archaeon]|nr:hypothetical protein [Candidatus Micrarchaeota archaeon]